MGRVPRGQRNGLGQYTQFTLNPQLCLPIRIPIWYTRIMSTQQVAVRLPAPLLARLDDLVESGAYESRAAVVRAGIEAVAAVEQRRRIDRAIVDGYSRLPPTEAEDRAALVSLGEAVLEEPW